MKYLTGRGADVHAVNKVSHRCFPYTVTNVGVDVTKCFLSHF